MPLKNEHGEIVDMSLMIYNAADWTMDGRRLAVQWLLAQAKHIMEHAHEFAPEYRMRRLHAEDEASEIHERDG